MDWKETSKLVMVPYQQRISSGGGSGRGGGFNSTTRHRIRTQFFIQHCHGHRRRRQFDWWVAALWPSEMILQMNSGLAGAKNTISNFFKIIILTHKPLFVHFIILSPYYCSKQIWLGSAVGRDEAHMHILFVKSNVALKKRLELATVSESEVRWLAVVTCDTICRRWRLLPPFLWRWLKSLAKHLQTWLRINNLIQF